MAVVEKIVIVTLMLFSISFDGIESFPIDEAVAKFTNDVYQVLLRQSRNGNIAFSPLSLHCALTLAYEGAAGNTSKVLEDVLNLDGQETAASNYKKLIHELTLTVGNKINPTHFANGLFVYSNLTITDSLKNVAINSFDSEIYPINFKDSSAAHDINSWVANKTAGKITNLLTPQQINDVTKLLIVNALHFDDKWLFKFDPANSKTEPFYESANYTVPVTMMHSTVGCFYREIEELDAKMIRLDYFYIYPGSSMILILPNKRDGIKTLESKLNPANIHSYLEGVLFYPNVDVSLPKFKIESQLLLKSVLSELGLGEIFSNNANFSRLIQNSDVKVGDVIQKIYVHVDEEGTKAAAVSAVSHKGNAPAIRPPLRKVEFKADHPFVFAVVNRPMNKLNILFYGRIVNPNKFH